MCVNDDPSERPTIQTQGGEEFLSESVRISIPIRHQNHLQ